MSRAPITFAIFCAWMSQGSLIVWCDVVQLMPSSWVRLSVIRLLAYLIHSDGFVLASYIHSLPYVSCLGSYLRLCSYFPAASNFQCSELRVCASKSGLSDIRTELPHSDFLLPSSALGQSLSCHLSRRHGLLNMGLATATPLTRSEPYRYQTMCQQFLRFQTGGSRRGSR